MGRIVKIVVWGMLLSLALLFIASFAHNYSSSDNTSTQEATPWETVQGQGEIQTDNNDTGIVYGFDEEINVNGYAITFGHGYSYEVVSNRFSDYYGKSAIRLPFRQTNNSNEPGRFNDYALSIYGPDGVGLSHSISALFSDSLLHSPSIMPGVTQDTFIYFLYAGPGLYTFFVDGHLGEEDVKIELQFEDAN